jgi:hypothetical protein
MEALGAVSNITSLITTILQGVEYIQLARTFDDDLKVHQLRLDLIRLRLSRWGQATGILKADEEGERQPTNPENPQKAQDKSFDIEDNADAIEDLLSTINNVLEKAKNESIKMESTAARGTSTSTSDASPDTELSPPRFKRLQLKIRHIVTQRYHRAGDHWKGAKWILYKKDQCEALTARLIELLDELDKMAVTSEEKLEELGREECDGMGDSLKTLLEVAGQVDPLLVVCATQKVEGERVARGVSVSAGVNNGVQMGVNYGAFKGISFGTGNSITNQWGRD